MGYGAEPHVYPRLLTFAILLPIAGYGALPHDYEKPLPFALELALVALLPYSPAFCFLLSSRPALRRR